MIDSFLKFNTPVCILFVFFSVIKPEISDGGKICVCLFKDV